MSDRRKCVRALCTASTLGIVPLLFVSGMTHVGANRRCGEAFGRNRFHGPLGGVHIPGKRRRATSISYLGTSCGMELKEMTKAVSLDVF